MNHRRRNAEQTKLEIRRAARDLWSQRPYDLVGVREIAAHAGVTAALVNRYFGSKAELFRSAIGDAGEDESDASERIRGPGADVARALHGPLAVDESHETHGVADDRVFSEHNANALMMLLRSAPSPSAREFLRDYVQRSVLPKLAHDTPAGAVNERATMLLVLSLGAMVLGDVMGEPPNLAALAASVDAQLDGAALGASPNRFSQLLAATLHTIATYPLLP